MTAASCGRCARPLPHHAHLCGECRRWLDRRLRSIPELVDQLDVTVTRQARISVGGKSSEQIPFDPAASDVADDLRNTITTWARHVAEASGTGLLDVERWPELGAWLADRLRFLNRRPEIVEFGRDIGRVRARVMAVIDRPPALRYAGPCTCGLPLYVLPGATAAACEACKASHDVAELRARMIDALIDRLETAARAADIATALGLRTTSAQVRGWAFRGRLVPHGHTALANPLYRVGDVCTLAVEQLQQRSARHARATSGVS